MSSFDPATRIWSSLAQCMMCVTLLVLVLPADATADQGTVNSADAIADPDLRTLLLQVASAVEDEPFWTPGDDVVQTARQALLEELGA